MGISRVIKMWSCMGNKRFTYYVFFSMSLFINYQVHLQNLKAQKDIKEEGGNSWGQSNPCDEKERQLMREKELRREKLI